MRPFSLGVTTLVQGLYALFWVIVLFDVASPTLNVDGIPDWTGMQLALALVVLLVASMALGVVMHTISKGLLHRVKLKWTLDVLSSDAVRNRMTESLDAALYPGGPKYKNIFAEEPPQRVHTAAGFMHTAEFAILSRSADLYRVVQVYRDQCRLARGFILPSVAFAVVLPLWHPVAALDIAGSIGPFPIIRTQVFLLGLLAAAVSYVAFRERSYRYAAAQMLALATLEAREKRP